MMRAAKVVSLHDRWNWASQSVKLRLNKGHTENQEQITQKQKDKNKRLVLDWIEKKEFDSDLDEKNEMRILGEISVQKEI